MNAWKQQAAWAGLIALAVTHACPHSFGRGGIIDHAVYKDLMDRLRAHCNQDERDEFCEVPSSEWCLKNCGGPNGRWCWESAWPSSCHCPSPSFGTPCSDHRTPHRPLTKDASARYSMPKSAPGWKPTTGVANRAPIVSPPWAAWSTDAWARFTARTASAPQTSNAPRGSPAATSPPGERALGYGSAFQWVPVHLEHGATIHR